MHFRGHGPITVSRARFGQSQIDWDSERSSSCQSFFSIFFFKSSFINQDIETQNLRLAQGGHTKGQFGL